eukprot:GHVH01015901.1.p2 GENE.GHVH01015901.1~~GHVH01015901.1.p2  ORF type:complete len:547 (+),score=57.17 GHVH01015901.1:4743-6383(+)
MSSVVIHVGSPKASDTDSLLYYPTSKLSLRDESVSTKKRSRPRDDAIDNMSVKRGVLSVDRRHRSYEMDIRTPASIIRTVERLIDKVKESLTGERIHYKIVLDHHSKSSTTGTVFDSVETTRVYRPMRILSLILTLIHKLFEMTSTSSVSLSTDIPTPTVETLSAQSLPTIQIENRMYPFPASLKHASSCLDEDPESFPGRIFSAKGKRSEEEAFAEKSLKQIRISSWWACVLSCVFPSSTLTKMPFVQPCVRVTWPDLDCASYREAFHQPPHGSVKWARPLEVKRHLEASLTSRLSAVQESNRYATMTKDVQSAFESRNCEPLELSAHLVSPSVFEERRYSDHHYVKTPPSSMSICLEVVNHGDQPIMFWSVEPGAAWRSYEEKDFKTFADKYPLHLNGLPNGSDGCGWRPTHCIPPVYDYLETSRLVILPQYRGIRLFQLGLYVWNYMLATEGQEVTSHADHPHANSLPIRIRTKSSSAARSFERHGMIKDVSSTARHNIFYSPILIQLPSAPDGDVSLFDGKSFRKHEVDIHHPKLQRIDAED